MDPGQAAAIPQGEAFQTLVDFTGEPARALTEVMYQSHNIGMVWYLMGAVGLASAVGMIFYGRWVASAARSRAAMARPAAESA